MIINILKFHCTKTNKMWEKFCKGDYNKKVVYWGLSAIFLSSWKRTDLNFENIFERGESSFPWFEFHLSHRQIVESLQSILKNNDKPNFCKQMSLWTIIQRVLKYFKPNGIRLLNILKFGFHKVRFWNVWNHGYS